MQSAQKNKYVEYIRTSKKALKNGLILNKVYRVFQSNQKT